MDHHAYRSHSALIYIGHNISCNISRALIFFVFFLETNKKEKKLEFDLRVFGKVFREFFSPFQHLANLLNSFAFLADGLFKRRRFEKLKLGIECQRCFRCIVVGGNMDLKDVKVHHFVSILMNCKILLNHDFNYIHNNEPQATFHQNVLPLNRKMSFTHFCSC